MITTIYCLNIWSKHFWHWGVTSAQSLCFKIILLSLERTRSHFLAPDRCLKVCRNSSHLRHREDHMRAHQHLDGKVHQKGLPGPKKRCCVQQSGPSEPPGLQDIYTKYCRLRRRNVLKQPCMHFIHTIYIIIQRVGTFKSCVCSTEGHLNLI